MDLGGSDARDAAWRGRGQGADFTGARDVYDRRPSVGSSRLVSTRGRSGTCPRCGERRGCHHATPLHTPSCDSAELHPRPGANGVWRYDPAEVVRLQAMRTDPGRRTAGQTAAAAFHMFDTGVEFKDCVILLQLSPGEVRRLYKEWQSSFDDPPPKLERPDGPLLDEDPRAEEAFERAMAQAAALADSSIPLPFSKPPRKRKEPR